MAAVSEETNLNEVESEITSEELKPVKDSTEETDDKTEESNEPKAEDQGEKTNGDAKHDYKPEEDKIEEKALGATVAKHYNEHPEGTKETRQKSRIYYMRNLNNWIKSVIINEFLNKIKKFNYRNIHVLDLCCGKGGDLLKWQKGRIRKLVCADIAKVSVDQCKDRYDEMKRNAERRRYRDPMFDTQFIVADCSKERLADVYEDKELVFDLASCQFSFHYSFESYEQADMMLKNACEKLKPGGYFVGTTTNANELVNRVTKAEGLEFGNDIFKISFESKDSFPLFGCKYDFKLEDVVNCPEFLLYFPVLEKMAKKYSMKLVYAKPFHEFYQENCEEHKVLLSRMNALETYPARHGDELISESEDSYSHAKDFIEGSQAGKEDTSTSKYKDHRDKDYVGTLSKEEWEAVGMYIAFAFVKVDRIDDDESTKKSETSEMTSEGTSEQPAHAAEEQISEQQETAQESATDGKDESRKRRLEDDGADDNAEEPPEKKVNEKDD